MPIPGVGNNPGGDNAFSGPMGSKEPAYGVGERMKILSKIGVQAPPGVNAPKRSQRAAKKTAKTQAPQEAAAPQMVPEQAPIASYDQELVQFWGELASHPGASPLVRQIANEVAR